MFQEDKRPEHDDSSDDDDAMEGSLFGTEDSDEGLFVNNNRQGFMDDDETSEDEQTQE